jgi:hypothetical protein
MVTTQGNSVCSYLYLKLAKHHNSLFVFCIFSSTKSQNRSVELVVGAGGTSGREEVGRKGAGG